MFVDELRSYEVGASFLSASASEMMVWLDTTVDG